MSTKGEGLKTKDEPHGARYSILGTENPAIRNPISAIKWLLPILLVTLILDQLVKWWVTSSIAGGPPVTIIDGFLRLRYTENRGAAFGFFQGWTGALSIVAIAVIAAILVSATRLGGGSRWGLLALGLITGGALGNVIDRLRLGYVVDFVDVYGPRIELDHTYYTFPVFNVADSGITVGAILLIGTFLFGNQATTTAPATGTDPSNESSLPTRRARNTQTAAPVDPTPAGWAGLLMLLAGLFLMALRLANRRS